MRLKGRVALITGAASGDGDGVKGIGGACAWVFSREGARLVLTDLDEARGERTAAQIRESGGDALFLHLDVTDEHGWTEAVRETLDQFGKLDILVNCAGSTASASVEDTTVEMWDSQIAVHATSVFLGTRAAIPAMRTNGGGSVVNISSMVAMIGAGFGTAYSAGKGATRSFTKAAAVQYARDGIRVNSVHPGWTDTPLARTTMEEIVARTGGDHRVEKIPMGRLASAEEIAFAILYLASDEASYVTGAELLVDGGVTAQ